MSEKTILCISSYFKGEAFLRAAKEQGCRVLLLTEDKLRHDHWPFDHIDQIMTMPLPSMINAQHMTNAVSYLSRGTKIDLLVALDEFDLENAGILREHLLLPGMGTTATRPWRDKLTMRTHTSKQGIPVPEFIGVFNYNDLREFMNRVPAPWVLKPRLQAGAIGIKRIYSQEELWRWLDQLGDEQSYRLLEQYIPGDVYHVDSIVWEKKILFASVQKYGQPPLNVSHDGGVFTTRTLPRDSEDAKALQELNEKVIKVMGLERGVTHAEYIKSNSDGKFYFLEIAARVGGANISDLIEAATGINPWAEWAKIEIAHLRGETYKLPKAKKDYGGLLVSLAKQEHPDTSAYSDPEVVWRMNKKQHAGLIVASPSFDRVQTLLDEYSQRFVHDFMAVAPPVEKATH